tara:strand:+ start:168 stop:719 length:552 start_codon:yes stop_codon:yes gene_type:complete
MPDRNNEAVSHNYDSVNQYIDDQAKLKRSVSNWRNAKSISLILLTIGFLVLLLSWAYNIYKKPNPDLMRKINEVDKKFEQSKSLDKQQEKIVDGKVVKYNQETLKFLSATSGGFNIQTRFVYKTTKDLLEGNKPETVECYIGKGSISFEYERDKDMQASSLELLEITYEQAKTYQKYCQYSNY